MRKEVAIIGTDGLPARYGGFETSVEQIVPLLARDFDFRVFCSGIGRSGIKGGRHNGVRLTYLPLKANGIQALLYDFVSILMARRAHIIIVLGPSIGFLFPLLRFFWSGRLVVHVDGLEWKRSQWGWFARNLAKLNEKMACRYADAVVSDNLAITKYLQSKYTGLRIADIAYGGDHAAVVKTEGSRSPEPTAYSLCRVVPENNVKLILQAFSAVPAWQLKFWGNWNNSSYGRGLRAAFGSQKNIALLDPEYDQEKVGEEISQCWLYVHGHTVGGTNPSLVEAMYRGSNIACADNDFNRNTTGQLGLFFSGRKSLQNLLEEHLCVVHHDKSAMSLQKYAQSNYKWSAVAQKYNSLLESL